MQRESSATLFLAQYLHMYIVKFGISDVTPPTWQIILCFCAPESSHILMPHCSTSDRMPCDVLFSTQIRLTTCLNLHEHSSRAALGRARVMNKHNLMYESMRLNNKPQLRPGTSDSTTSIEDLRHH